MIEHVLDDLRGLTPRARAYLVKHATRREVWTSGQTRRHWYRQGRSAREVEHVVAYQERWGGLELPPTPEYEGGPLVLDADEPVELDGLGICLDAGPQRSAMAYAFRVDGQGRFGIVADDIWVPLHGSVEGWVEAAALRQLADGLSVEPVVGTGPKVDELAKQHRLRPVKQVDGLADEWWHGPDTLLAVYRGEARLFGNPQYQTAYLYLGIRHLADRLRQGLPARRAPRRAGPRTPS